MNDNEIREQAWKYFELHAKQRMTLFNFYITISTALIAGIGVLLNFKEIPILLIITLGVLMVIFSLVFWLLDSRTRFFIHLAEKVIREIEIDYSKDSYKILTIEEKESNKLSMIFRYTIALRIVFILFMILGIISILYTSFWIT